MLFCWGICLLGGRVSLIGNFRDGKYVFGDSRIRSKFRGIEMSLVLMGLRWVLSICCRLSEGFGVVIISIIVRI